MKEVKLKTKNARITLICIVMFIIAQVLTIVSDRIGTAEFNGVFMACQFGLCLVIIWHRQKSGTLISLILMGISLLLAVRAMFVYNLLRPLPGVCNTLIDIFTLIMLAEQFQIRENDAITDYLTGLRNRRGLDRLIRTNVEEGKSFYLLYIDFSNFRMINDNQGHSYGNQLLKSVAQKIVACVNIHGTVTRIDGSEFVVVLNGDQDPAEYAEEILRGIREKITINWHNNNVDSFLDAYVGIAAYPQDAEQSEELLKYADIAVSRARADKSKTAYFFDKRMEELLSNEVELERLIKLGLEQNYFYLVYQPQYKMVGKELRGFEALLRFQTPDGCKIKPSEFIPLAEKCNLIFDIDKYVLKRAMSEFAEAVAHTKNPLTISVNVSAKNIGNPQFVQFVQQMMEETHFPAEHLELEITEYCLVDSIDDTISNIQALRNMGVQIALDDFGTGYTSLSYLAKMPVNLLKIDKSLIDDIEKDGKNREFVHAVISMGYMMGCEVISEGVESEEQIEILKEQECDFVQGYVWSGPLDYSEAVSMI